MTDELILLELKKLNQAMQQLLCFQRLNARRSDLGQPASDTVEGKSSASGVPRETDGRQPNVARR